MYMTRRHGARFLVSALGAVVFASTALVAASPAQADTQSYLKDMSDAGIHTARGELDVLEGGWEVCELIRRGFPPDKVMQQALYNSGSSPYYGLTTEQADTMYRLAVQDLCSARK
jgi:Protein of unknown function (DUF732)